MRQLARGVLAALVLVMAACGDSGGRGDDAVSNASAVPATDLAASSRLAAPDTVVESHGSFTIAVTSPEGVDSAGLDAAVSVLLARPDTNVVAIAPAADARNDADGRSTAAIAAVDGTTMTGYPAAVVNGTMLDAIDVLATGAQRPDLVVIGVTDGAGEGSAALAGATAAVEAGLAVLIVAVTGEDPDLASAALLLASVADYDLDALIESPAVHVLTVPACDAGVLRGPVTVDPATADDPAPVVDCTSTDVGPFDDEHDAWAAGHATLAEYRSL